MKSIPSIKLTSLSSKSIQRFWFWLRKRSLSLVGWRPASGHHLLHQQHSSFHLAQRENEMNEFVEELTALPLGVPLHSNQPIRSIHQLHWWTAAQVDWFSFRSFFDGLVCLSSFVFSFAEQPSGPLTAQANPKRRPNQPLLLFINPQTNEMGWFVLIDWRKKLGCLLSAGTAAPSIINNWWLKGWTVPLAPRCSAKRNQNQSFLPIRKRRKVDCLISLLAGPVSTSPN